MSLTDAQWLNIIGIILEAVSLFIIIFSIPTRNNAIGTKIDELFAGMVYEPSYIETREGQFLVSIPLILGLLCQIRATIIS